MDKPKSKMIPEIADKKKLPKKKKWMLCAYFGEIATSNC